MALPRAQKQRLSAQRHRKCIIYSRERFTRSPPYTLSPCLPHAAEAGPAPYEFRHAFVSLDGCVVHFWPQRHIGGGACLEISQKTLAFQIQESPFLSSLNFCLECKRDI